MKIVPFLLSFIWFMQMWPNSVPKEQATIVRYAIPMDNYLYLNVKTEHENFLLPQRYNLPKKVREYYGLEDNYEFVMETARQAKKR